MTSSHEVPNDASYAFTPDSLDPAEAIERILRDPELEARAGGDPQHLRFLQEQQLASLRLALDPENETALTEFIRTRDTLETYERYGKGVRNIPLPGR